MSEAIDGFLDAVDDGSARDRYGRAFTPEAARELHWCLGGYVGEELGDMRLIEVRRDDVETLLFDLRDRGVPHQRLRALAKSMRALYDYAAERDLVRHNPADRVGVPDQDETQQPTPAHPTRARFGAARTATDRAISLALRGLTLCFLVVALFFLAESM